MARPLLFLDVDGPLNPYAGTRRSLHRAGYSRHPANADVLLCRSHGEAVLTLPLEPVWATTWEHGANAWIGPFLALPELPVVEWPDAAPAYGGLHWKTVPIVDFASDRPFAWVDDELGDADRDFVARHHPGPALLHYVDPALGLADGDFAALKAWAEHAAAPTGDAP
ncbi:HAD domain-containing protein [Nocardiopsis halophila]|uniref:hypothetical protein n=1 Tax=Nocardiopsis halophila TaxID=141692 RepID=UPI000348F3B7|nr:hypothetical protein [Nocardiopsis halophila]